MKPRRQGASSWWHFLLASLLVLLSLPVLAGLALALRLWAGPVDVTDTARRLAHADLPGLGFDRVRLTWNGWSEGPAAPLGLIVDGVRLDDPRIGRMRIGRAEVALNLLALLHGRLLPTTLAAEDGSIDLGRVTKATNSSGGLNLRALREVVLTRMVIGAAGLPCRAAVGTLRLAPLRRPAATGVTGRIAASLSCGGAALAVAGEAQEGPQGEIVWHVVTGRFVPAPLASRLAALAPLAGVDLPVRVQVDAALSGGYGRLMLPRHLDMTARLGAGVIRGGGAPGSGVGIVSGVLRGTLDLPEASGGAMRAVLLPSRIVLRQGEGAAAMPVLDLSGGLRQTGPAIALHVRARIARLDFAGLGGIWPPALAPGGRRWMSANVTAGAGRDLDATAGFASSGGWRALRLTSLTGGLDASDLTVFWLRPIEPLRVADAHLVLEDPDSLRIESRQATEPVPGHGAIAVGPTVMRITGLSGRDQSAQISATLRGGLPDMLALLAHPRLRLLSRHPLSFTDVSGTAVAQLGLTLPLSEKITAADLLIRATAALTAVHLGNAVLGRALDADALTLHASDAGLRLQGEATIGGIAAQASYSMDFRAGGPAQVTEAAHVSANLDRPGLARAGLAWLGSEAAFSGSAGLDVDYARRRDGDTRVGIDADLTGAGLDTPVWRKRAGEAARASAVIGLRHGALVSIEAVHAIGAALSLEAHAETGDGRVDALVIDGFTLGRSRGAGRIDLPASSGRGGIRIALHGPTLDLAPYLGAHGHPTGQGAGAGTGAGGSGGTSWRTQLAFRTVLLTPGHPFSDMRFSAAATGGRIDSAHLVSAGPTAVQATLSPDAAGRRVALHVQDTGALLNAFWGNDRISGGNLSLDGVLLDTPDGIRMTGRAKIGRFAVRDAPLSARLARDLSIYGFLTGSPSKQIVIARCETRFTLQDRTLRLDDAHASNAALGATLRGSIDLRHSTLDLRGTIVPSYLLNALPGKLPGVGRVFSPEKGGGLLALTVRVTGPIDKPVVGVDPLSLLAPGILRRLLFD